jgi:membrane-associated phospholipid phosphatase
MHHPSDVMIGAVYGASCLWVAVLAVRAIPARDPSLDAHDSGRAAPDSEGTPGTRPAADWEVVA